MATTRCACGEQIHYSADKVGFNARCRCGRTVTLPKIALAPPPKTVEEMLEDEQRSERIRRQVLAVGVMLIVTIGLVLAVALYQPSTKPRQIREPAAEVEP